MDGQQAWQSALGQLQMEMPKASFDTWVRDTHILSYDGSKFTIGVRNAYARDWLESRLSNTAAQLLMGILNQDVEVQFVVSYDKDSTRQEEVNSSTTMIPDYSAATPRRCNFKFHEKLVPCS